MTKTEKFLLKRLAESHAFVYDLRKLAEQREDIVYLRKTKGIEQVIKLYQKKYPRLYIRYLNRASAVATNGKKQKDEGRKEEKKKIRPRKRIQAAKKEVKETKKEEKKSE